MNGFDCSGYAGDWCKSSARSTVAISEAMRQGVDMTVRRDGAVVHRARPAAAIAVAVCGVLAVGLSVVAASSTDVQANSPQVASDPTSDSTATFPTNKQNEPTIAVNPVSANLIAGSNDEQEQPACGAAIRGTDRFGLLVLPRCWYRRCVHVGRQRPDVGQQRAARRSAGVAGVATRQRRRPRDRLRAAVQPADQDLQHDGVRRVLPEPGLLQAGRASRATRHPSSSSCREAPTTGLPGRGPRSSPTVTASRSTTRTRSGPTRTRARRSTDGCTLPGPSSEASLGAPSRS